MQKLLILIGIIASLLLAACSGDPVVNRLPWVYRIEIQQGNVVTQEQLNLLRTGMTKRQVQFVMGAPMLVDPFHASRWDYYYSYKPGTQGKGEAGSEQVTLFFTGDELTRITGTLKPDLAPATQPSRQVTVDVPPQEVEEPGILTRLWRWIGFGRDDEYLSDSSGPAGSDARDSGASQAEPSVY
jgi:outer membrane protein assembly factor BamE